MPRRRVTRGAFAALLSLPVWAGGCGGEDTKNPPPQSTTTTGTASGGGGTGGTAGSTGGGGTTTDTGGGGTATSSGGSTGGTGTAGTTGGTGTTGGSAGTGGTGGQTLCGNGMLDPGEACEGDDLGGATCESLGYPGGTLACFPSCGLDATGCIGGEGLCADGADNDGNGLVDCAEPACQPACDDACVAPDALGDPDDRTGSNAGHANVLASSCIGASGPDVAYVITAAKTGVLDVIAFESGTPVGLSVRTACGDVSSELGCTSTYAPGRTDLKRLTVPITAGQTVFVLVEGDGAAAAGPYSIYAESRPIICGDGIVDPSEGCDDANTNDGDGCSATCTVE